MRKIIANMSWIFFDKIFRMVASILIGIWIARYLGPSDFGILNYSILFPTAFISLAGFGLTNVLMVELVTANQNSVRQYQLISTGLLIKLISGILSYIIVFFLNYLFYYNDHSLFVLINLSSIVLVFQSADVIDTYFQSQTKAKLSVLVKIVALCIASLVRVYGLISHQGLLFFAFINALELLINYVLVLVIFHYNSGQSFSGLLKAADCDLVRKLISLSWPIMVTEFFVFIYMRIDQFMIESLSTTNELGYYSAALRLSEVWYFIAIAITTSLYPRIAAQFDTSKALFYTSYQDLINILAYISLLLSIFITLFSNNIISILYGNDYKNVSPILSVHIWSSVFVFLGVGSSNLMTIEKLQRFVLVKTIAGAFINVVLNFWLIPLYGALGASIATLIAYAFSAYIFNVFYQKSKPIFLIQTQAFINFISFKWPFSRHSLFS